ncbi:MAG: energy transducer TonB [Candidatus Omnitrophota bacterium]|nr:MAG: energy transducer TonB [Candidatus Omnitrophota bacterium]
MFLDRPLKIALLLSMAFHTIIFLPLLRFNKLASQKRQVLKITYVAPKAKPQPETSSVKEIIPPAKEQTSVPEKPKMEPPIKQLKETDKSAKDEIQVPPELPKEKEKVYLEYYKAVREEIRRFVIESSPRFIACGEVCLYFVLSSDGKLEEIKVVEERSTKNQQLKKIAARGVQGAAPFSPFPEDLGEKQLSFNVVISFELEN